jgi:signal transduction histidine kinase/CheY-like chemotaxis protein
MDNQANKNYVLVVDDNQDRRNEYKVWLEKKDYIFVGAANSDEAEKKVDERNGKFEFVIMDMFLGSDSYKDGIELTKDLTVKYDKLKVILVTQFSGLEPSASALGSGIYRYIVYDWDIKKIVEFGINIKEINLLEKRLMNKGKIPLLEFMQDIGEAIIVDETYTILYSNEFSTNNLNVSGRNICWILCGRDLPCLGCPVNECFKNKRKCSSIIMLVKEGKLRHYEMTAIPIWDKNRNSVIAAIEMMNDVTGREVKKGFMENLMGADSREKKYNTVLSYILSLGYKRARIYEFSSSGYSIKGILQLGSKEHGFDDSIILVDEDSYTEKLKSSSIPLIQTSFADRNSLRCFGADKWIDVPVKLDNKLVGIITVDNLDERPIPDGIEKKLPEPLTLKDFDRLLEMAGYVGETILEGRNEENMVKQAKQLKMLSNMVNEITLARHNDLTIEDIYNIILKYAQELTGADSGHIRLLKGDDLVLVAGNGIYYKEAATEALKIAQYKEARSVSALINWKPEIASNAHKDALFMEGVTSLKLKGKYYEMNELLKTKSLVCYPIIIHGSEKDVVNTDINIVLSLFSEKYDYFDQATETLIGDFLWIVAKELHNNNLISKLQGALIKLEDTEKKKNELLKRMAHSFNLPLHTIIGYITRLLEGKDKKEIERERDYQAIYRQVKHFEKNVHDMLNLIRFEEDRLYAKFSKVDLGKLVNESVDIFKYSAEQRGIRLYSEANEGKYYALADEYMVEEIILNLLSNAILYTEDGGSVVVQVVSEQGHISVKVEDTGIGILEDEQESIFDKLKRGSNASQMSMDGRGIGLTVSRAMANIQGGSLECRSRIGEGSCFTLRLQSYLNS